MMPDRKTVTRYIRARTWKGAQTRAFKALGMRTAAIGIASQQAMLAHIGTVGYDQACNARETQALSTSALRSMQSHAGADNTGRGCYKPNERERTKLNNRAQELMRLLGMI